MAIKTWNGIPIANIKTINGIPIANVKTWNGIDIGAASSYITSVQQVSITLGSTVTSNTATISSVNTATSAIFLNWESTDNASTSCTVTQAKVELTNATTVTANRDTGTNSVTINATVVEFTSAAVNSVQAGVIDLTNTTSNTATITSVDTATSVAIWLNVYGNLGANNARLPTKISLTNATTVTATRGGSNANSLFVGWMVVEFKSAVIQSVQQTTTTLTSANTSDTATITSVNTANTILIWQGISGGGQTVLNYGYRATLTNGTTITLTRNGTDTTTRTINVTALEFASGVINTIQRGTIAVDSATSNTATVTSVNTAKSFVNYVGFSTDFAVATYDTAYPRITLTNATTVTATKGSNAATATTVGYEVVEFV